MNKEIEKCCSTFFIQFSLAVFLLFGLQTSLLAQKSQGFGTSSPHPRAVIDLNVEDPINFPQGLLFPRLTTQQRLALQTVAGLPAGMSVYDDTEKKFYIWNAATWELSGGGGSQWTTSGANIFYTGGNVSVGTSTVTSSRLSIQALGNSSTTSALNIVNSTGASILYMRDDGMMGINNTTPGYHLHVNGRVKSNGLTETSDRRLKTDIVDLTQVLEKVIQLQGVSYVLKNDKENSKASNQKNKEIGLIAQEVEILYPELVHTDENGFKSLEYSRIVALLIEAIKEQQIEIQRINSNLQHLQSEIGTLKAEWKAHKQELERTYPVKSGK